MINAMFTQRAFAVLVMTAALLPAKNADPNNPTGTTGVIPVSYTHLFFSRYSQSTPMF